MGGQISDLVDKLNVEWPSIIHEDNTEYWKNEWDSHGICSEAVLPQHAYFDAALKLKQKYNLLEILAQKGLKFFITHLHSSCDCLLLKSVTFFLSKDTNMFLQLFHDY